VHRGECFEAQKDGRYGWNTVASPRGLQTIEEDVEAVQAAEWSRGFLQKAVNDTWKSEISRFRLRRGLVGLFHLDRRAGTYPAGGLDAFYLGQGVSQGGAVPNQQQPSRLAAHLGLISWHYSQDRPWNPSRDDLASHIAHCRGFS